MAEEKHHHHHFFHHDDDEEKPTQVPSSAATAYHDQYGVVAEITESVATESQVDHEKEEEHHKHKEVLGELGAAADGAFALDLPLSNESPKQGPQNAIVETETNNPEPSAPSGRVRRPVPGMSGKQDRPERMSETVLASAIACILAVLGISDYSVSSNGAVAPKYLFHRHQTSFSFYLLVSMAACCLSFIALIFQRALPALAKAIHGVATAAIILSITVLLWALLPDELSWLPWVFFVLTLLAIFGLLAYQRATRLKGHWKNF